MKSNLGEDFSSETVEQSMPIVCVCVCAITASNGCAKQCLFLVFGWDWKLFFGPLPFVALCADVSCMLMGY